MPLRILQLPLLLFAVFAVSLVAAPIANAASQGCADDATGVADLQSWVPELLAATNEYRASKGLSKLALDATLTKASLWKARDMARRNYFNHPDPANGGAPERTPWDRMSACGYSANAYKAENLAAGQGTAQATVQAWIDSPGHRANLESSNMKYVGFGVSTSSSSTYTRYMVQMFASAPGPASVQPPVSNEPGPGP
ncbi:MAG: CAP domain-containing protein, partial [Gaiellales bacterium]